MTRDPARLSEEFDRIASLTRCEEPDRYEPLLMAHLPATIGAALDVGCGTGSMSRRLAARARHVTGIDLSPAMIARARERARGMPNVEFRLGDFLTAPFPEAAFDVIVAVATLHHLEWDRAVARLTALLRPGGTLGVLDLAADATPADLARTAIGWTLERVAALGRPRPDPACQRAWKEHGRGERYLSVRELRRRTATTLPGAHVRRLLFFRWMLIWRRPGPNR
jgi:SAM-dependent methyltransferase